MINALGLLEVSGLAAGIEAADAMLKAAKVRIISQAITNPGMVTLVVEGDLAACRAALDAGAAAAGRLGYVVSRKDMGRPDADTEWMVQMINQPGLSEPEDKSTNVLAPQDLSSQTTAVVVDTMAAETALNESMTATNNVASVLALTQQSLLAFIAAQPKGCNVTELMSHFAGDQTELNRLLIDDMHNGLLQKKDDRYYVIANDLIENDLIENKKNSGNKKVAKDKKVKKAGKAGKASEAKK